jgi:hypothetical protein
MRAFGLVVLALFVFVPGALGAPPAVGAEHGTEWVPQPIGADFTGIAQVGPMFHCVAGACPGAPVDGGRRGCRLWVRTEDDGWRRGYVAWNFHHQYYYVTPYAQGWHWAYDIGSGQWSALATKCLWGWQLAPARPG